MQGRTAQCRVFNWEFQAKTCFISDIVDTTSSCSLFLKDNQYFFELVLGNFPRHEFFSHL